MFAIPFNFSSGTAGFWTGHFSLHTVSLLSVCSVNHLELVYNVLGTLWTTTRKTVAWFNNPVYTQLGFLKKLMESELACFFSVQSNCLLPNKWNSWIDSVVTEEEIMSSIFKCHLWLFFFLQLKFLGVLIHFALETPDHNNRRCSLSDWTVLGLAIKSSSVETPHSCWKDNKAVANIAFWSWLQLCSFCRESNLIT